MSVATFMFVSLGLLLAVVAVLAIMRDEDDD